MTMINKNPRTFLILLTLCACAAGCTNSNSTETRPLTQAPSKASVLRKGHLKETEADCNNLLLITLHVKMNDPEPDPNMAGPGVVEIHKGDCVRWLTSKDDSSDTDPVSLTKIHFLNPGDSQFGKNPDLYELSNPDVCQSGKEPCTVRFESDVDTGPTYASYSYVATVQHGNKTEHSDPEIQVYCDGCPPFEKDHAKHKP